MFRILLPLLGLLLLASCSISIQMGKPPQLKHVVVAWLKDHGNAAQRRQLLSKNNKDNKDIKKDTFQTDYQIIKHKRKNYYLVENKVYSINKNKSLGDLFGEYVNASVVENIKPEEKIKLKTDYQIIKHKRKNYYLIDNKVYSINKNKSFGEVFGDYITPNGMLISMKNELKIIC